MNTELFSLEGRVALVTGASSGIGRTLAAGLAGAGATVVAAARRVERLTALVEEIAAAGGRALAVALDVTDPASVTAAFDAAEAGAGTVDLIVNNAGVADPKHFLGIDDESLDYVMNTNFRGVWQVAREGAGRLVDARMPGSIVNIASILGLGAAPGQSAYCASKGAVVQLTRSLALDLMRHDIRVNAIAPGWFRTEINEEFFRSSEGQDYIRRIPARRLGELPELLGPVLLLASSAGSFVNGAILPVDGAHMVRLV
jgi:NAD(P)-dependent dehydrogenase (short-subunit alcohol dehydrogenase family)